MNFITKILPLALLNLLAGISAQAEEPSQPNTSALYASPITMAITSGELGLPVISIGYEHSLTDHGLAIFIPIHAGYTEDNSSRTFAFGAGLGLRKYIGASFSGSYLTAQSDYLQGEDRSSGSYYQYNPATNQEVLISGKDRVQNIFLSVTQLSYGYKWMWKQVALDLSLGGAFYANKDGKNTSFIGSANIGIPFSKQTFGF